MVSNVSIVLGLSIGGKKASYKKNIDSDEYPARPFSIAIIFVATTLIGFLNVLPGWIFGKIGTYIRNFFMDSETILILTSLYLIINYKKISGRYRIIIPSLLGIFIILHMLSGARSALLRFALLLVFILLTLKYKIIFSKKSILIGATLVPLLLIANFVGGTYVRKMLTNPERRLFSIAQVSFFKESFSFLESEDPIRIYRPIFLRIGFLDHAASVMRNSEEYRKIMNFSYYFKSFVDNSILLTPLYDVFDTPRAACSFRYIARGKSIPLRKNVMGKNYHSTMFTVYGEYYVLFNGYPALIFLFVFSYIFKKAYLSIRNKDIVLFHFYKVLVLLFFYRWLDSFGMDWMLLHLIPVFITIVLFKNFYMMKTPEKASKH